MDMTAENICNRHLKTSTAPLESHAHGTSLFKRATSNQRGCPKSCRRGSYPVARGGIVAVNAGVALGESGKTEDRKMRDLRS